MSATRHREGAGQRMTSTFYKAVRLDGRNFNNGSVLYEPGWTYTVTERDHLTPELCTDTVIHASKSPALTLIGGWWPCRLFEVDGEPVVSDHQKSGFSEFTVVREVPAWWALGPNGRDVEWLLGKSAGATTDEVRRLGAARGTAWGAAREAARVAAREAARVAARGAAWETAWVAARGAARVEAREAAREAARGLTVRDLIRADQYDLLYGPFRSVFGDPPKFRGGGYPKVEAMTGGVAR